MSQASVSPLVSAKNPDLSDDALAAILGAMASSSDIETLMSLLSRHLSCDVTFTVSCDHTEHGSETAPLVCQGTDALWVRVPLSIDHRQLGWLRAATDDRSEIWVQLMRLAGKMIAGIFCEQASTHWTWAKLLHGQVVSEAELRTAVCALNWPDNCVIAVLSASPINQKTPVQPGKPAGHLWSRTSVRVGRDIELVPLVLCRDSALAVFAPLSGVGGHGDTSVVKDFALQAQADLRTHFDQDYAIGVGGVTDRLDCLAKLWSNADRARVWGVALHGRPTITYSDSMGLLNLLADHVPPDYSADLCGRVLGPLLRQDDLKGTEFVHTLQVYLDADCRCAEAAERLFVHENTLRYRVQRIQEILGLDLSDPHIRADVFYCLKLLRLALAKERAGTYSAIQPGSSYKPERRKKTL